MTHLMWYIKSYLNTHTHNLVTSLGIPPASHPDCTCFRCGFGISFDHFLYASKWNLPFVKDSLYKYTDEKIQADHLLIERDISHIIMPGDLPS